MAFENGIRFDTMPSKYWDDHVKISYLQRRIIVWSIMYYELDSSVVSDKAFDTVSRQLVQLQQSVDQKEFKRSTYYYAMRDFDGSTGFDIPARLTKKDRQYLTQIAQMVLRQAGGERKAEC